MWHKIFLHSKNTHLYIIYLSRNTLAPHFSHSCQKRNVHNKWTKRNLRLLISTLGWKCYHFLSDASIIIIIYLWRSLMVRNPCKLPRTMCSPIIHISDTCSFRTWDCRYLPFTENRCNAFLSCKDWMKKYQWSQFKT